MKLKPIPVSWFKSEVFMPEWDTYLSELEKASGKELQKARDARSWTYIYYQRYLRATPEWKPHYKKLFTNGVRTFLGEMERERAILAGETGERPEIAKAEEDLRQKVLTQSFKETEAVYQMEKRRVAALNKASEVSAKPIAKGIAGVGLLPLAIIGIVGYLVGREILKGV